MARILVERNTIYTEEVQMLLDGASVEEVLAFMDEQDAASNENPFARMERSSKRSPVKETTSAEPAEEKAENAEAEEANPSESEETASGESEEKKDE